MLILDRVSFAYPDSQPLFTNLDAHVGPGEVLAIVGRNGAGKSTLLRLINGLLRPVGGRVLIAGQPTAGMKVSLIAASVGTLFQTPEQQLFASSVRDEIAFGPRQFGNVPADVQRRVALALARTGIEAIADRHPLDLDYASRRLVTLASVLASAPPVLLLDEPQRGLDRRWMQRLEDIIAEERAADRAVILICHDMEFVYRNATGVLALGVAHPEQQDVHAFFADHDLIERASVERISRSLIQDLL